MPDKRTVHYCLLNLDSVREQDKKRLMEAGFVSGNEVTLLGNRVLTGTCTVKDIIELRTKLASWYCYRRAGYAGRSPIDCGDR